MPDRTQSFIDLLRRFGSDLGLPTIDVDKLIETDRKNIEALEQSASTISQSTRSIVEKNLEILEVGLREATTVARDFRPMAAGADAAEKHAEFARKIFDYATKNTREIEELANQSSKEVGRIFRERLKALFDEIGAGRDIMAD